MDMTTKDIQVIFLSKAQIQSRKYRTPRFRYSDDMDSKKYQYLYMFTYKTNPVFQQFSSQIALFKL